MDTLPVMYKMHQNEVVALFPTLPGTMDKFTCLSYAHFGQHGSASTDLFHVRNATPDEYSSLHQELTQIYNDVTLRIVKRVSSKMNQQRYLSLKE